MLLKELLTASDADGNGLSCLIDSEMHCFEFLRLVIILAKSVEDVELIRKIQGRVDRDAIDHH